MNEAVVVSSMDETKRRHVLRIIRLGIYLTVKRIFDIICALIGLVFLLPVALIVKISYVLTGDFHSIFFTQKRIGKNGKEFNFYKFRTMIVDAYEVLETTGTKSDRTYFSSNIPELKVKPIIYYCEVTSEVSTEFTQKLNDYEINSGSATLEYYNADFTQKSSLEALLSSNNDFRVVYKSNGAYAITNILRSGC